MSTTSYSIHLSHGQLLAVAHPYQDDPGMAFLQLHVGRMHEHSISIHGLDRVIAARLAQAINQAGQSPGQSPSPSEEQP